MDEVLPDGVRSFADLDDAVPAYDHFLGVDEHRERDRALAAAHDHVRLADHGETPGGEPLWSVTVGEGRRTALLIGAPHPNEPIGSTTVDFLLHELAENDALRASLDWEFVCVPVADPDDYRRNEGWFDGPFTLANYAQNFYPPPPHEQVEATFPVERDDYSFDDPVAGTEMLADLIERHRPEFVYSLHNTIFGGCYYVVSEPMEPLHGALQALPGEYGVPLHLGEPEYFGRELHDDAVEELIGFEGRYESVREEGDEDAVPADGLLGGNARDYARELGDDPVEFVVELPYFVDPRVDDETELDRSRESVIREGIERRRAVVREMRAASRAVAEHLPETPLVAEATGVAEHFEGVYDDKLEWAAEAEETDAPATVAEELDALAITEYEHLHTYVGMLLRAIDQAAMSADGEARRRLVDTKAALEELLYDRLAALRRELDYETIPIRDLVAIQARAGLVCLDHRQKHGDRPGD
jgi:hypothetical protein